MCERQKAERGGRLTDGGVGGKMKEDAKKIEIDENDEDGDSKKKESRHKWDHVSELSCGISWFRPSSRQ